MDLSPTIQKIAECPLCTLKIEEERAEDPYFIFGGGYEDWANDENIEHIASGYIESGDPFTLSVFEPDYQAEQEERDYRELHATHAPGKV